MVTGTGYAAIIINLLFNFNLDKMNKITKVLLLAGLLSAGAFTTNAQIVVRVRPARPVAVIRRPPPPSPRHVWVEEDWVLSSGRYVWHGGYWAAPPRPRAFYVPGHWRNTPRGSVWVPGHWR
ncbi:hypothetical protein DIU31_024385 [Mucilaginibacter rubeus]|uniref:BcpO-related WXXGXW repeat protein n=3 Tax=Sphingobacteriaceae TaxID=84566 RepID=A0AAE6MKJ2_9SPHI|nr:hypothetical protein DIU31_024385 [Mucilaginibacter rubeus]QEM19087.1 hypothetical protein DIU38_024645 [Mucilaginibacter gossypii]